MWTKQHQTFCPACGRATNHVTHYKKDDVGALIAFVQCVECSKSPDVAA